MVAYDYSDYIIFVVFVIVCVCVCVMQKQCRDKMCIRDRSSLVQCKTWPALSLTNPYGTQPQ